MEFRNYKVGKFGDVLGWDGLLEKRYSIVRMIVKKF